MGGHRPVGIAEPVGFLARNDAVRIVPQQQGAAWPQIARDELVEVTGESDLGRLAGPGPLHHCDDLRSALGPVDEGDSTVMVTSSLRSNTFTRTSADPSSHT